MDVQRIGGIKFDLDRLTDDELENIHGHLLDQHVSVTDEIGVIEFKLFQRRNTPLPIEEQIEYMGEHPAIEPGDVPRSYENYAHVLGQAITRGEITAYEGYAAINRPD